MTVTSRSSCISDSTVIVDVIVLRTLKLEISTYFCIVKCQFVCALLAYFTKTGPI